MYNLLTSIEKELLAYKAEPSRIIIPLSSFITLFFVFGLVADDLFSSAMHLPLFYFMTTICLWFMTLLESHNGFNEDCAIGLLETQIIRKIPLYYIVLAKLLSSILAIIIPSIMIVGFISFLLLQGQHLNITQLFALFCASATFVNIHLFSASIITGRTKKNTTATIISAIFSMPIIIFLQLSLMNVKYIILLLAMSWLSILIMTVLTSLSIRISTMR